jgi:hypothetical protein
MGNRSQVERHRPVQFSAFASLERIAAYLLKIYKVSATAVIGM